MKKTIYAIACVAAIAASCTTSGQKDFPAYLDGTKSVEERVEDALGRMSTEEKVAMTHAQSKFSSKGVPSLGIPDVWHSDGPHGIRSEVLWDKWQQAG